MNCLLPLNSPGSLLEVTAGPDGWLIKRKIAQQKALMRFLIKVAACSGHVLNFQSNRSNYKLKPLKSQQ